MTGVVSNESNLTFFGDLNKTVSNESPSGLFWNFCWCVWARLLCFLVFVLLTKKILFTLKRTHTHADIYNNTSLCVYLKRFVMFECVCVCVHGHAMMMITFWVNFCGRSSNDVSKDENFSLFGFFFCSVFLSVLKDEHWIRYYIYMVCDLPFKIGNHFVVKKQTEGGWRGTSLG